MAYLVQIFTPAYQFDKNAEPCILLQYNQNENCNTAIQTTVATLLGGSLVGGFCNLGMVVEYKIRRNQHETFCDRLDLRSYGLIQQLLFGGK